MLSEIIGEDKVLSTDEKIALKDALISIPLFTKLQVKLHFTHMKVTLKNYGLQAVTTYFPETHSFYLQKHYVIKSGKHRFWLVMTKMSVLKLTNDIPVFHIQV